MKEKNCKICGNIFLTNNTRIFYCGDICKKNHYDKGREKTIATNMGRCGGITLNLIYIKGLN